MKNTKANKATSKTAAHKNGNGKAAKAKASKASKKATPARKRQRFTLFGFPASRVIHRLGELKWKASEALAAIHRMPGCKAMSPNAIRNMIYSGRRGDARKAGYVAQVKPADVAKLRRLVPRTA
jgi:hypothetical protein